jgi:O-antigen/teichoic acid export membrane protein
LTLLVSLVLSIWLVLFEKMHVTGALMAGLLASLFRAVLYWSDSKRHFRWVGLDRKLLKDLLSYGLPVIPHKVQAQVIQTFTAFMINHKLGIAAAGLYAVATKLAKPLSFIVSIVQQSWVPFKFQVHKNDPNPAHTFKQLISLYWVGMIALWGIFSLLTPWLYHWLIDPKYWSGIPYVPFIMAISVAQAVYFTVTTGFELSPRQGIVIKASFLGMITLVGLTLLTTDMYAPYSFILAQALAYLIMGAVLYPEASQIIKIEYPFASMFLFAAVISSLIALLFNHQDILPTFLGLLSIVSLTMVATKVLFPKMSMKRIFPTLSGKTV